MHAQADTKIGPSAQAMIAGSYCIIAKKYPEYAVGALLSVVVVQGQSLGFNKGITTDASAKRASV